MLSSYRLVFFCRSSEPRRWRVTSPASEPDRLQYEKRLNGGLLTACLRPTQSTMSPSLSAVRALPARRRVKLPLATVSRTRNVSTETIRPYKFHVGASWLAKPTDRAVRKSASPYPADSPIGRWRDETLAKGSAFASASASGAGEDFFYIQDVRAISRSRPGPFFACSYISLSPLSTNVDAKPVGRYVSPCARPSALNRRWSASAGPLARDCRRRRRLGVERCRPVALLAVAYVPRTTIRRARVGW